MTHPGIPSLSTVAGYLPWGILAGTSLTACAITALGVVTVLTALEPGIGSATAKQRLVKMAMLAKQLALPILLGSLVGGVPGILAAVGIYRFYEGYKHRPEPQPPELLSDCPSLSRVRQYANITQLPSVDEIKQLFQTTDPSARFQLALHLGKMVPPSPNGIATKMVIIPNACQALFNIPKNVSTSHDFVHDFNTFLKAMKQALKSSQATPPDLENVLQLTFFVMSFDKGYTETMVDYACKQLKETGHTLTLDQLIQLAKTYRATINHTDQNKSIKFSCTQLRTHLLEILQQKMTTDSGVDTLKIAQAFGLLDDQAQQNLTLQQLRHADRAALQYGERLLPEQWAVLVGSGYCHLEDLDNPNSAKLTPEQIETQHTVINSQIAHFQRQSGEYAAQAADKIITGILRLLQQLSLTPHGLEYTTVHTTLSHMLDSICPAQFKLDVLLSWYALSDSIVTTSNAEQIAAIRDTLQSFIINKLWSELHLAFNGSAHAAMWTVGKIIATADAIGDDSLSQAVLAAYDQAQQKIVEQQQEIEQRKEEALSEQQRQRRQGGVIATVGAVACACLLIL